MCSNHGTVDVDNLGQAAYSGKVAVVNDALTSSNQLAHVADTVGNLGNSYRCNRIGNYYPGGSKTIQGVIKYVVKTMETTGGWKL